ncbi:MAG: transcriptional repressor [Henriciella sp.]|nr:transcriptional repressor [Henriciella sp.]
MTRFRTRSPATGKRRLHRRRWRQPDSKKPSREELLQAAADEAQLSGKSLTAIRKHVLNVLLDAQRPMTAYEVLASLDGVGSVSPPTAYRALDFLVSLGFVSRVESLNAYLALDLGPSDVPLAFFVCEKCGQAQEISANDAIISLMSAADQQGFGVSHASLEVRGDCRGKLGCDHWDGKTGPAAASAAIDEHSHK